MACSTIAISSGMVPLSRSSRCVSTTSGKERIVAASSWSFLGEILPFLKGFTLFFWAAGTWWIPLLVAMGFWRHAWRRVPLRYDPQYWSLVFPLGMYSVATYVFSSVTGFAYLEGIAGVFAVVALGAWGVVFTGMIRALQRTLWSCMARRGG